MKKVLIITYYWPPSGGAGVQRWLKFVKYLRQFDWEPVIFTPENAEFPSVDRSLMNDIPEDVEVIKNTIWEPYQFYKRFTGKNKGERVQAGFLSEEENKNTFLENMAVWLRGNLFIPDARKFWINPSVKFLSNYLIEHPVNLIVSTGPPHSAHIIALKLKEKFRIPWLADFRDPWTNIDFYHNLYLSKWADAKHHKMEKKVLKEADSITVVSKGMQTDFNTIYKRNYIIIPNGFDEDDVVLSKNNQKKDGNDFVLSHVGSLNKDRNPLNLWQALKELISEDKVFRDNLKIRNVGKIDFVAVEAIKNFGLGKYLDKVNYLTHQKVIAQQQNASLLLLLINRTPNAKLLVTGKIFEYLVSGRPILCIGPLDGDAASIIDNTNCGKVVDFNEVTGLKEYLKKAFKLHQQGELKPQCSNIEQYNRKNLTKRLTELFDEMV